MRFNRYAGALKRRDMELEEEIDNFLYDTLEQKNLKARRLLTALLDHTPMDTAQTNLVGSCLATLNKDRDLIPRVAFDDATRKAIRYLLHKYQRRIENKLPPVPQGLDFKEDLVRRVFGGVS